MDKAGVILTTVVVYKLTLIAIGVAAERLNRSEADLFLGGRRLGPFVAGLSYGASNASAWSILGLSGAAYLNGLSVVWLIGGLLLGHGFSWFWIAPRLRRATAESGALTAPEFLAGPERGTGRALAAGVAAVLILLSFVIYVAAQFEAAGATFHATFGMDKSLAIALGGVIVLIYTVLGGFWAVSLTDALQGVLMLFAAILLPITAIVSLGGPAGYIEAVAAAAPPDLLRLTSGNAGLAALGAILGALSIGFGALGQPHLLTRFMATRDDQAIAQARLIALGWTALVFAGMFALGLAGHALAADLGNHETVFFAAANALLPPVIAGVLIAAVLSAIMSTADSQLLVSASAIAHDLKANRIFAGREVLLSRLAIAIVSAGAIAIAVYAPSDIYSRVLFSWSALGAAFGPLAIARLARWPISGVRAAAVMSVGFALTVWFHYFGAEFGPFGERFVPFAAAFALTLALRDRARSTIPLKE